MKNIYAVINPQTQFIVGYIQLPTPIKAPFLTEAYATETYTSNMRQIPDFIVTDDPEFVAKYDPELHRDLDVKNETNYEVVIDNKHIPILTNTTNLLKLREKLLKLNLTTTVKQMVEKLAFKFDQFIIKSIKNKPVEKCKIDDVLLIDDKIYHLVSIIENDGEQPAFVAREIINVKDDQKVEYGQEIELTQDEVFRIGRF